MSNDEFQKPSSGAGRRLLLLLILIVAAGAVAYDFLAAKPAYDEAYAKLESYRENVLAEDGDTLLEGGKPISKADVDHDGHVTPEDVHALIDRQPASVETDEESGMLVEKYSWRRGIPFATYDAWVIYNQGDERATVYKVVNSAPTRSDFRQRYQTKGDRPADLGLAGGAPSTGDDSDDKDDDSDKSTDDKSTDDKSTDDKGDQAPKSDDDKGADDKGADDKGADDTGGGDGKADDGKTDDAPAGDQQADDKSADDKSADDKEGGDAGGAGDSTGDDESGDKGGEGEPKDDIPATR